MTDAERIARACVGALLAIQEMAELGIDSEAISEFADLTIRAATKQLQLSTTNSQESQLKEENILFLANANLQ